MKSASFSIALFLLGLSLLFYVLGLSYPILTTKQGIAGISWRAESVWLFSSIKYFYQSNEPFLGTVIFLFTIIFPILKYLELFNRVTRLIPLSPRVSIALEYLDKWSMLDVFIVALLLMNYKMDSQVIAMKLKAGTSFLALSIISRMMATIVMHRSRSPD